MSYQVEIGGNADAQLAGLDTAIGAGVERKIQWLADNALAWFIAGSSVCRKIWPDSASSAWAIIASFIGFIPQKRLSVFTASSTVPKSIAISKLM